MLPRKARLPGGIAVLALRALIAAAAILVAGCGEDDSQTDEAQVPMRTDLHVTLDPDGPESPTEPLVDDVSCDEGETGRVCRAAEELEPSDLEPVPPDVACTQIYGGPDQVTIEGTLRGEAVDATLTRANGCEIERFEQALPLVQSLFPDYTPGASLR